MAYNGFKNWSQWNVSLWINNDEGLYNMAREYVRYGRRNGGRAAAARAMLEALQEFGIEKTPDGARYTLTAIRGAMVGM